jgi:glycosyltransferase involved in cell wall biosynthesis
VHLALTTTNLDQWASWSETADARPDDAAITALFVGQLIPRKQPEVILALASLARDQHLGVRFQVVGSGDMRAELEERAKRQGLDAVEFLGELPPPELAALYARADCLLFPTKADIWGLVVNEAMACGLVPVISPNAECHRDLIVHGHNGFVVDFDRLDDVLTVLQLSRSEPERWAQLRVAAREDVFRLAPASRWADGFVSAIKSALSLHRHDRTRT